MSAPPGPVNVPTEDDVRDLVARIVDAVLDDDGALPSTPPPPPSAPPAVAPQPAEHGPQANAAVAIGADHGGFALKERLAFRLKEAGHTVVDVGTHSHEPVDYPDLALAVAEKVASGECAAGVIVDGAGIGSAMVANKVPGVRAALCYDLSSARNSREHNHANVLTLGAGLIGDGLAWQIVEEWLSVPWGGDRHARRVEKITAVEQRYAK